MNPTLQTIPTMMERFKAKYVVDPSGCWVWTACKDRGGYGRFGTHATGGVPAYRWIWEQVNGLVPAGMVLDHLCRNRACVNPEHLEVVTRGENVRRGHPGVWKRPDVCKRGHSLADAYRFRSRAGGIRRACRVCNRERQRTGGRSAA